MINLIKSLLVLSLSLLLGSCHFSMNQVDGNGNVTERDLAINGDFNEIKASNGWDVQLKKGTTPGVRAKIDENLYEYLDVHIDGNRLEIEMKDNYNLGNTSSRMIYVTYTNPIERIKASSAASINSEDVIEGEHIDLDVSSAGSISVELAVREVTADASSAGDLQIKGIAESFTGEASSAASIEAQNLKTEHSELDASSAGSIEIFASKSINAEASSGGSVDYWGNPKETRDSESSGGSVDRKS